MIKTKLLKVVSLALIACLTLTIIPVSAMGNQNSRSGGSRGSSNPSQQWGGGGNSGFSQGGQNQNFNQGNQNQNENQNSNQDEFSQDDVSQDEVSQDDQSSSYVTRGELMNMIVKAFGFKAKVLGNFSDVSASDENYSSIGIAKSVGIVRGNGNKFNSSRYITVSEATVFLQRVIDALEESSAIDSSIDLSDYFGDSSTADYATSDQLTEAIQAIKDAYGDLTIDTDYGNKKIDSDYKKVDSDYKKGSGGIVVYTTNTNTAVTFNVYEFNSICKSKTGSALSYVQFTLPSSTYGTLYYNYTSDSIYDSLVSADTSYFISATPYLSKVSFVPYTDFNGALQITYTAYSTAGKSYTGIIKISVID